MDYSTFLQIGQKTLGNVLVIHKTHLASVCLGGGGGGGGYSVLVGMELQLHSHANEWTKNSKKLLGDGDMI